MSRISGIKRDPVKVRNIFRSIARNTASMVAKTTIVKDIIDYDSGYITCPTLYEYLDALERLMIIENQPAYSTHIIFLRTHRLEHYRLQPTFPTVMACSGLSPYSFRPFWGYTQFKARRGRDTKGINL